MRSKHVEQQAKPSFKPLPIAAGVQWIGVPDPDLEIFDVIMPTEWGTTYNSYLVEGTEKKAIVETVKEKFGPEYLAVLAQTVDLAKIDYIILNHTEPDHSGALPEFLKAMPNATVVSSKFAHGLLKEILNTEDFPAQTVRDGDSLDLGGKTLHFISAPYLHWPDSMFTYLKEEQVLFSGDVFGCHYYHTAMYDDLVGDFSKAFDYYFETIMSPFREHMLTAIDKIRDLEIKTICTAHGPILRTNPRRYIDRMEELAKTVRHKNTPPQVFIGYVSAYGNTRKLAEAIGEGAKAAGAQVILRDVSEQDIAQSVREAESSEAIVMGSPTFNKDAVKPVWDVLYTLSIFKVKGKLGGAFGSFGWSGEGPDLLEKRLQQLGIKLQQPALKTKLVPNDKAIEDAKVFGRGIADALLAE
ncbi:MAG TPA: FprA family A-type flavoprotein [Firmicutes bacterium]|jgi:flavorubredoxin|nr:FprA family A-type flavoprotein [Bacillota bacterium]